MENRFRSGTEKVSKQTQYFVEGGLVSVSKQTQSLAEGGLVSILNKLRIFLKVAWLEIANSFSSWSSSIRSSANSKLWPSSSPISPSKEAPRTTISLKRVVTSYILNLCICRYWLRCSHSVIWQGTFPWRWNPTRTQGGSELRQHLFGIFGTTLQLSSSLEPDYGKA